MSLTILQSLISPMFDTEDLLKIVKNYSDLDAISLNKIQIAPSSQKIGDSYLSKIVRFTIEATGINKRGDKESVTVNVITKVFPPNLGRRKTFRSEDFFENEIIFYDKVWRSMKAFYEAKNLQKVFGEIIPLFLAFNLDGENTFICLEDLSYKNYDSVERGNGIDHFYTTVAMDSFAKFHSLSLTFKDQKPGEFTELAKSLKETYFSEKFRGWYSNLQHTLFDLVRDAVKKELPQVYFDKIDQIFKDDFYSKCVDICEKNHSNLSGITEGDAWIPNFLFKKEERDKLHVTLIDFQLARWAPFSNDVTFFLLTCVEENILIEHWDEFIEEYGKKMKEYLQLLGSSPNVFDVEEFKEDIKKNIVFTIAMSIEALTMSLLDGFDLDVIKGDEAVPLESVWIIHPFQVANMMKLIIDKGFI